MEAAGSLLDRASGFDRNAAGSLAIESVKKSRRGVPEGGETTTRMTLRLLRGETGRVSSAPASTDPGDAGASASAADGGMQMLGCTALERAASNAASGTRGDERGGRVKGGVVRGVGGGGIPTRRPRNQCNNQLGWEVYDVRSAIHLRKN